MAEPTLKNIFIFYSYALLLIFSLNYLITPGPVILKTSLGYDYKSNISCEANSMGVWAKCGNKLDHIMVIPGDHLYWGDVYTYNKSNHTNDIFHRLILCLDQINRSDLCIFKGDNNNIGEIVKRSDIISKVVAIRY